MCKPAEYRYKQIEIILKMCKTKPQNYDVWKQGNFDDVFCVVFDVFSDFSLFKNQNCNLMFVFFNAQDKKAICKIKIISRKNLWTMQTQIDLNVGSDSHEYLYTLYYMQVNSFCWILFRFFVKQFFRWGVACGGGCGASSAGKKSIFR